MALPFVRCAVLSVSFSVLVAKAAAATGCASETCANDNEEDDVTMVQLPFRTQTRPSKNPMLVVDEEDEISSLLQNSVQEQAQAQAQAKAQKERTEPESDRDDPESASAAPSDEEDVFIGQWHGDSGQNGTITRENASWYRIESDDPADPDQLTFAYRVNSTHIEQYMPSGQLVVQGEIQEGNHHLHWHYGFVHEEWQKVGFEEEDTRWMHGSRPDAEHPLVDYDVTPEEFLHVTQEQFVDMEEHNHSIAHEAQADINAHADRMPVLVPLHQPLYWTEGEEDYNSSAVQEARLAAAEEAFAHNFQEHTVAQEEEFIHGLEKSHSTGPQPEGASASSSEPSSEEAEDEEPVSFLQTEAAERLREVFARARDVVGDEEMVRGYKRITQAIENRAHFGDSDLKSDDPNTVMQALDVLSTKFGRGIGEKLATKIVEVVRTKLDEKQASLEETTDEKQASLEENTASVVPERHELRRLTPRR